MTWTDPYEIKETCPCNRGMPTLAAKAAVSWPSFYKEPMLTYRKEEMEGH